MFSLRADDCGDVRGRLGVCEQLRAHVRARAHDDHDRARARAHDDHDHDHNRARARAHAHDDYARAHVHVHVGRHNRCVYARAFHRHTLANCHLDHQFAHPDYHFPHLRQFLLNFCFFPEKVHI